MYVCLFIPVFIQSSQENRRPQATNAKYQGAKNFILGANTGEYQSGLT